MSTVLGRLAVASAIGLVATGAPLIVLYRPAGGASWLLTLHGLSSSLFVGATAAMLVAAAVGAMARHRAWVTWPLALGATAVAVAGSFTGQLIAWDLLGLTAVTVGGTYQGVIDPLTEDIRFLIVGDAEVAPGTYMLWLGVHLVVLPVAAGALGRVLWRRWRAWESERRLAEAAAVDTPLAVPAHDGDDRGRGPTSSGSA
ncbi:MAG: hypothetical protein JXA83_14695 [Acidimicrobiales bacterium]|nr:hypothetical protein [Acidimicrobiales bacterium]